MTPAQTESAQPRSLDHAALAMSTYKMRNGFFLPGTDRAEGLQRREAAGLGLSSGEGYVCKTALPGSY